ncbi:uncharacterized protein LOC121769288 isoform X4 [Salvia splendens]|uniref:uncharacterized protein LOC121769288 isoform X4 n=1 Tax=Salvia splendens TaxID=180675 RepID=UPI001C271F14|nr:uncharacterized protein LOC121769288 isoform X4 [Salvia splendens]
MIACSCRSLLRLNFLVRETANTSAKSKTLLNFKKTKFWHSFSCELNMDARSGRGNVNDRKNRQNVRQTWRAVSTQPDRSEGETLRRKLRSRLELKFYFHHLEKKIQSCTIAVLEGNSAKSITQASEMIQAIIDKAVNSRELDYSHFVSLPLAIYPGLLDKLVNFQETILGKTVDDKDKNTDNENHSTAPKFSAEMEANKNDTQHPTETPLVAEVKAVGADTHVRVNITNIPLVSYPAKESKATSSSKMIDSGIEKSIFIKPTTFHLTVLMLKLWNKERVKSATEVLQSVSSKVMDALENRPLSIRLKGLDCMRGSKAKAFVLYAPVKEIGGEGRLLRACKVITDAFVDAGLVVGNDAGQLKLHATLMNARHRKRKTRSARVDPFDARGIFDLYGNEEWGEYCISEAHLSQRFAFDENGYYHCCASIPFPENVQKD